MTVAQRAGAGLVALALLLLLLAMMRDRLDAWVDATTLPSTLAQSSVEMRDRNGRLLRAYTVDNGIWRLAPTLSAVDDGFLRMLVRYEDKRFYHHNGVDALALLRAAGQALRHGRAVSGGSTLTMQVARLLENGSTGKWAGKLRQMRVALALERRLDKDAILALYLTHAPYGGNIEGLRSASLAWFGKEPGRLATAEAALLVALPQSPETRRPDRYPAVAQAARQRILDRMVKQGVLHRDEAERAIQAALPARLIPFPRLAPHLGDRLRAEAPDLRRHDLTLDGAVQGALEELIAHTARRAGSRLSAAVIAADHRSGEIIASVGSPAYAAVGHRQGFVDMTRAIRSPGSTLKPLIYGLAFDQGLVHPNSLIRDAPVQFGDYAPRNFDGTFRGDLRVRDALRLSLNIPVVKLARELGPARVMAGLDRAGVMAHLPGGRAGLAMALGGVGVSLRDLVQLYAALAQGGQGPLLRATSGAEGRLGRRIMSEVAAWHIGDILAQVPPPSGAAPGVLAYKTGTSYGHRDAWAIGYDGQHVVGVWIGRADGSPVPGAFGGDLAAPVLFQAFGRLKQHFSPLPPPPPATLMAATADLPLPLQRFRSRDARFTRPADAPQLVFPPDGAVLAETEGVVTVKLRGGTAPYLLMANGRPVVAGQRRTEFDVQGLGPGYSTLTLVDRNGRSDRVTVRLN